MTPPALSARGIEFSFADGREVLRGVSLDVERGECVGLIGPNGAGKTTLLHILTGLLAPTRGTRTVTGKEFTGAERDLRRRLGLVLQQTEDQLFSPTVRDDVAFGPINFGATPDEVARAVRSSLRLVGLEDYEDRISHHLSSGERRRVALASVLSYEPDVLILDEPTSDLDPGGRRDLTRLLRSTEQAKLVASHDMELILRACDRVLLLVDGRIHVDLPPERIAARGELLRLHGLDVPLGLHHLTDEEIGERLRREREEI